MTDQDALKQRRFRSLSYVTHAHLVDAYERYTQETGTRPKIVVKGSVDFIAPGQRVAWRKLRTVDLAEWCEVKEWSHTEARMLILFWGQSQGHKTLKEQWVRPDPWFGQWEQVQLRPIQEKMQTSEALHTQQEVSRHEEPTTQGLHTEPGAPVQPTASRPEMAQTHVEDDSLQ